MAVHDSTEGGTPRFPPTRRSAVLAAGSDDPVERSRSFDVLARAYWRPAYKHVRLRWRRSTEDASDLVQGFFARAFEKGYIARYEPARARFRTFFKLCLDRYVMEEARDARRHKRGGGAVHLAFDFDSAEGEIVASAAPQQDCFEREWARGLLADAVQSLAGVCAAAGKDAYYAVFQRYVLEAAEGEDRPSYADVARELGLSVSDITNYLAWTRRTLRSIVMERLREITATEAELRDEARELFGIES